MQKSDMFEYLAAFVSIVLALALSDIVQSTHRLVRARQKVKWDPLTPLLALSLFFGLLAAFFSLWGDARFERLSYYGLVAFMIGPTVTALAAFAVLPDEVPETGLDLREFFFDNRRYIAILLAVLAINDTLWALRWAQMMNMLNRADFWWHFAPVATLNGVWIAVLYISKSWRVQFAGLIAVLALGHFAFGGWYIDTVPG